MAFALTSAEFPPLPSPPTPAAAPEGLALPADLGLPDQALYIRSEWCREILYGRKRWELRSTRTSKRGPVCIAESGAKRLVGRAVIRDCFAVGLRDASGQWQPAGSTPVDLERFWLRAENAPLHAVRDSAVVNNYKRLFAWVLEDVEPFDQPLPWAPPSGPVQFVNLAGRLLEPACSLPNLALRDVAPGLKDVSPDSDVLWPGLSAGQEIPPGALLEHMFLAPCRRSELRTTGPTTWAGPCLAVPPDGLCIVYCFLAAQAPRQWAALPRSEAGFVENQEQERALLAKAQAIRRDVVSRMRAQGAAALADGLERGGLPGDEEFRFYAERFGCAFLVAPEDPDGLPTIYGHGPVGFEVKHTYGRGRRGEAVAAGHYVFARSWLADCAEMAGSKASAFAARSNPASKPRALSGILRRLRSKRAAPEYGPPPRRVQVVLRRMTAKARKAHAQAKPLKGPAKPRSGVSLCKGFGRVACSFSLTAPGAPTQVKGSKRCVLCDKEALCKALAAPRGQGAVTRILKRLAAHGGEAGPFAVALGRVEEWAPHRLASLAAKARGPKRRAVKVDRAAETQERWSTCKRRREANEGQPDAKHLKAYRTSVLDDRRRAKKQFFPDAPRRPRESGDALVALVPNDCDLPPASASFEGIGLQNWCEKGAWGMCPNCFELQPRRLLEKDLQTQAGPELPFFFVSSAFAGSSPSVT